MNLEIALGDGRASGPMARILQNPRVLSAHSLKFDTRITEIESRILDVAWPEPSQLPD